MVCEWYDVQRMRQRVVPSYETWPSRDERPPTFDVVEATWSKQAAETGDAIREVRDWTMNVECRSMGNDEEPMIVSASMADISTQLALHEVHHRAQVINMLRHLGIALGDLDFKAMMYQRRKA